MGMALKADVLRACNRSGKRRPVDLVHLSAITMGDRSLEAEVLSMFCRQIPTYLERATQASGEEDIRRTAHTIKGAARGIGAFDLADIAAEAETARKFDMKLLKSAFEELERFVKAINKPSSDS